MQIKQYIFYTIQKDYFHIHLGAEKAQRFNIGFIFKEPISILIKKIKL